MEFSLRAIGTVSCSASGNMLEVDPQYRDGLLELEGYSHLQAFWWASDSDDPQKRLTLRVRIPYSRENVPAGVFACRSPERPNPLMVSVCRIRGINAPRGRIFVEKIDARHGTPLLDIKPYIPCCDRVRECRVPGWFPREWGEWFPAGGIG